MKYISASQCRAARGLLNWSQPDLAQRCGMHVQTISSFEQEIGSPTKRTLQKISQTLSMAGIDFSDEADGVRRALDKISKFHGRDGFKSFMDDVYETAKEHGGDICLFNSKPRMWLQWLGEDWYSMHAERMKALGDKIRVRITLQEGDTVFILPIAEHRWFGMDNWKEKMFYAYGPKLAFVDFSNNDVNIMVLNQQEYAQSFRILFDIAWENVAKKPKLGK